MKFIKKKFNSDKLILLEKIRKDLKFCKKLNIKIKTKDIDLKERRKLVSQEMYNKIYTGGGPDTLSHKEIDQWNIPKYKTTINYKDKTLKIYE